MKTIKILIILFLSIFIGACGKTADDQPTAYSVSGTAAEGAPIANLSVTIKDKNGSKLNGITGADGKYTINVAGKTPPYLLRVPAKNGGYLYSVATAAGTANIHPFTDLIIRNWYKVQGFDVETDFGGTGALVNIPAASEINTIEAVVRNILSANLASMGVTTSSFNLLTSGFDANHTGFDKVLDGTNVIVSASGAVTVTATDPATGITGAMVATNLSTDLTPVDSANPSNPTGLSVLPSGATSMVLVWNASTDNVGVAGFNIYRDTTRVGTSPYPVYSDTGLASGTNYCYQVEAFDGAGNVSAKSPATALCATTLVAADTTQPSAPTNLTATALSPSQIDLSWGASSDNVGVAGYAIYRGGIKVAAVNGTSYSDTGLASGTAYSYTVKALDGALNLSVASNAASATTQAGIPSAPAGVTAAAGDGQVTISWSAVSGATSYNVYWSTSSGVTKVGGTKVAGVTSQYIHTGRLNGTKYYYVVTAVNTSGESVESAQASATPAASTATVDVTGTWMTSMSGTIFSGESGAGQTTWMTLAFTQAGSVVSGTWSYSDTLGRSGALAISAATVTGTTLTFSSTDPDSNCSSRTGDWSANITGATPGSQVTVAVTAPAAGTCPALNASLIFTKQAGAAFLIANTSGLERSGGAAFDGTNFLVSVMKGVPRSIEAHLISKTGSLVGLSIPVTSAGCGGKVAFDGTNYLIAWKEEALPGTFIRGQFVSTSGTLIGSPFGIATGSNVTQNCTFGMVFDGLNYFVAWDDEVTFGNGDSKNIYGQFVTPGGTLLGSTIPISTAVHGQRDPVIDFDGTNILVVWPDGRNQSACFTNIVQATYDGEIYQPGTHCYESDIYGQLITKSGAAAAGALSGSNFLIDAGTLPRDNPTGIASDGTNYLVTFVEEAALPNACPVGGCSWEVYGILVSGAGTPTGSKFVIGNPTSGVKMFPVPAYVGTQYCVTWTDGMGTAASSLKGQYVTTSGAVSGAEFTLLSPTASDALPWLGMVYSGGGVNLAVTNWSLPNANEDVMGSIITLP